MATIYTTKAVYKAVSSQTIYSFGFDYLNKTFVKVKLGGQDLTYLQDYTVDEKTINLTNPPTQGVDLEIYRSTSTEQEVQWEDSSVFRANTLNLFQTQLLHLSQEALDGIRKASLKQDEVTYKWDAEGIQINNVGDPQESQDAVNLRYLSNLQDGYITQMEALITNAKNVAEADHRDYLNRFMALLANAQGQANRAESEATRAYNEANRAEGYANTAHDNEILVESYKNTVETLKNETKSNADSAVQSLSSVRAIEAEMQETLTAEQVNAESVRQEATQALTAITNATTTLDTRYAGAEQFVTEARQIRSEVAIDKSDTLSYKNTATEQAQLAKQYADLAEQISSGGLDYITNTEATNTFVTKTGTGASGTWGIDISGTATKATNDGNGANIADTYLKKTGDTFTGTLNVPTQDTADNSTKVASTAFVQSAVGNKVSQLVNSAPETLDTLNELSNALGDNPNFAITVTEMISQKADKTVVDNIVNVMYPVGIIVEFAEDVNPNTAWVGTTWERMKNGRVLVSAGQYNETNWEHLYTLGETGGGALHTLTTEEMPSHSHSGSTSTNGDHSHTVTTFNVFGKIYGNSSDGYCTGSTNRTTSTNGNHQHSINIDNTGGDMAHNNMQPYEVVHRWKRVG